MPSGFFSYRDHVRSLGQVAGMSRVTEREVTAPLPCCGGLIVMQCQLPMKPAAHETSCLLTQDIL